MVELCIIAYVYGYSNFIDDIYEMTGSKVCLIINPISNQLKNFRFQKHGGCNIDVV